VWANYGLDLHRFGRLDVAPLYRYNSARTFSLIANSVALTPEQMTSDPGYVKLPAGQPDEDVEGKGRRPGEPAGQAPRG
jgi:hypothetical protein